MESNIKDSALTLDKKIGKGASGKVYQATLKSELGDIVVAVKKIEIDEPDDINLEVSLLRSLSHPHVIKYHGHIKGEEDIQIVTEYAAKGTLYDHLRKLQKKNQRLALHQVYEWGIQAAEAIKYLKDQGVVHRDVKSPNMLITADDKIKLCDFGIAKRQEDGTYTNSSAASGTIKWQAPEVFIHNKVSHKADIFGLGIVLWELISGEIPYIGQNSYQIQVQVSEGGRLDIPDHCPEGFKQLIHRCWDGSRDNRPNIEAVLQDLKQLAKELTTREVAPQQAQAPRTPSNMETVNPLPRVQRSEHLPSRSGGNVGHLGLDEVDGGDSALDIKAKVLTQATEILCNNLDPHHILRRLKSEMVISEDEDSRIKSKVSKGDQVEELLDTLRRKSVQAYNSFMDVLKGDRDDLYRKVKHIEMRLTGRNADADYLVNKVQNIQLNQDLQPSISDHDMFHVVDIMGPSDLQHLFNGLRIPHRDIEKAEIRAQSSDVNLKAMEVLRHWRNIRGGKATKEAILEALERCNNAQTKEELEEDGWASGTWQQKE